MSEKEKKYTVDDILDEFGISEGKSAFDAFYGENGSEEKTSEAEADNEEIFADDADDVEVVTDMLEEDISEKVNAEISLAGESEWETPETFESDPGETFDGKENKDTEAVSEEPDEITETEENESEDSEQTADAETKEEKEPSDAEDINQKFAAKLFKGILPWKGDSIWEIIRKIIFLAAVIVFIGAGIMLISTLLQSRRAVQDKEEVSSIVESIMDTTVATTVDTNGNVVTIPPTKEEIAEHNFNLAEYFKNIAPDYKAFLELEGCGIQEPVMQTDNNDYYLTHTYYGGNNKAGAVFMDYRCSFGGDYISPNIVIYGHNQEDGTMFGDLKEYKQNVEFYKKNPVVKLSSDSETYEYLIYGFFVTNALEKQDSNGVVFHYHDYIETLNNENTFNWYMQMIKERNQIVSPVDVQYGDKLLCLSTCSNEFSNSRFVVFARMLREGETVQDYDLSKTYLNPYAKGVDWEAIMSGETSETEETEDAEDSETEDTTEEFVIKVFIDEGDDGETAETTETTRKRKKKQTETTVTSDESVSSEEESSSEETTETTEEARRDYGPTGTANSGEPAVSGDGNAPGEGGQESGAPSQPEQPAVTAPPAAGAEERPVTAGI